jgi:WD40-like Beta Propeller Repeat
MTNDTLRWVRVAVASAAMTIMLCSAVSNPATGGLVYSSAEEGPHYSAWSQPQVVSGLNTSLPEYPNGISRDGLSLYFQRANPVTGEDLYVAHRPDHEADWRVPVQLPDTINTSYNERAAFVSADGHWLYFASDRPGAWAVAICTSLGGRRFTMTTPGSRRRTFRQ